VPELEIGRPAPNFSAIDEKGQRRQLTDYRGSHVVIEWTNRDCAFVKKHYNANYMQALQNDARSRNVIWLTVTSTAPGQPGYMDADGAERFRNRYEALPAAILLDPDGRMGRQYDVEVTPQVFIIDRDGILVYMGGMDDRPSTRIADIDPATDFVGEALDDTLAGRPVARAVTRPYGCPIEY
jgi:peroxiredoxin